MKRRSHHFVVSLHVEAGPTLAKRYIKEAIKAWGGCYRPDDPFFGLQYDDIAVTPIHLKPYGK